MEGKLKHLEFVQNIITRMNSNSFMIKGWGVTLISALFALAAKDANVKYVLISYLVIPVFWFLDGYFISQERQYRELYKEIASKDKDSIDFNLDASEHNKGKNTWSCGIFSDTLITFYGVFFLVVVILMFLIK